MARLFQGRRFVKTPALLLIALPFFVPACIPPPPSYPPVDELLAEASPPSPLPEMIGEAPWAGAIWVAGFWSWDGVQYVWLPGRWEQDHPGWRWLAHHWERRGVRWHLVPGRWTAARD